MVSNTNETIISLPIYRQKDIQTEGYTDRRIYRQKDIQTEGYTDRRIDRQKDRQTEG